MLTANLIIISDIRIILHSEYYKNNFFIIYYRFILIIIFKKNDNFINISYNFLDTLIKIKSIWLLMCLISSAKIMHIWLNLKKLAFGD